MSQLDYKVKEIDGETYKVYKLDPFAATDLLNDVGQILGPSIATLGGAIVTEKEDVIQKVLDGFEDGEQTNIGSAIEQAVIHFLSRFSKDRQRDIINTLAKVTVVVKNSDGITKEPHLHTIFSVHFRGRIKTLYLWLAFALTTQFEDFFSGTTIDISRAVQKVLRPVSKYQST